MTVFQGTLIGVFGTLLVLTSVAIARKWLGARVGAIWIALWLVGLVAAAFPDLTTVVANAVGIDRGKDLVLYVATLVMLAGFFSVYLRLRRIRRELTIVVRHLALREADGDERQTS